MIEAMDLHGPNLFSLLTDPRGKTCAVLSTHAPRRKVVCTLYHARLLSTNKVSQGRPVDLILFMGLL